MVKALRNCSLIVIALRCAIVANTVLSTCFNLVQRTVDKVNTI